MRDELWGREVTSRVVDGHPCRVYERRRRHVAELLVDARRWRERPCLVHGDRRLTYLTHEAAIAAVARHLHDLGVRAGDRVLLLGANEPAWIIGFWSGLAAGAVSVLGNAWWSPDEIRAVVADCAPALVIADSQRLDRVPSSVPTLSFAAIDDLSGAAGDDDEIEVPNGDEDDPAVIVYTSGTTGAPKGAVLSHRSMVHNVHNLLSVTRRLPHEVPDDDPPRAALLTNPLFHMSGLNPLLSTLLTGGSLVMLVGRFDAGAVLELIERERIRSWGTVPTLVARLLDDPDFGRYDLSSLRAVSMGGAMVPTALAERARALLPGVGSSVSSLYGMTEAGGGLTTASGRELAARPGTVGRPFPVVEIRIHDPDDQGVGEILARTPTAMSGYWGSVEGIVDADGWIHSGDLGRVDDDGFLYVVDRSKDIVIRGGENVASAHVEHVLLRHPDVLEVAVLALPHDELGEEVAAVVVARGSAMPAERSLHDHCATALAPFEVPSRWWIRTEPLPTNAIGKVLKRELRADWRGRDG